MDAVARGGGALTPAGAAALVLSELGRYLVARDQRLRAALELEAVREVLQGRARRLEARLQANESYLEAQCRDRSDARQAIVALARELMAVATELLRAGREIAGPEGAELRRTAAESVAAAVAVIRDRFPAGPLGVIVEAG
jgi:hypothetical protein